MRYTCKSILIWIFIRIFGLRDISKFYKCIIKKIFHKSNNEYFGIIEINNDEQIDHWVESMPAGTKSCPYWYSTRLIKGTEVYPGSFKKPEYWVGIRVTFLTPVIPIPICSDEKIFKIGDSNKIFYDCFEKYGHYYDLINHKEEYTHRIIEEATIKFINTNETYKNDEVWSSYD